LKYWPSSRDFNKLVIKVKMHANTYFFEIFFVVWKYNMIFYFWETWPYAWKQNIFYVLTKKKDILIPDLYLYSIKIQTNIDQNAVKYLRKITDFFEISFEIFVLGLGPARPMWLGWTQQAPAGWQAQAPDPTDF